jgi:ATP-dependent DNA helicase PIF1
LQQLIKNCLAAEHLELKKGAQVMLIKNISEKLVNGCQGIIIGFHRTTNSKFVLEEKMLPVVRFTNGMEKIIQEEE